MIHISNKESRPRLPEKIYLIGSGKSLNDNHDRIPDNAYRVYLNGSVAIDGAKPDLWFAHCQSNPTKNWWMQAYKKHYNISFFGNFITDMGFPSKFYFKFYEDLSKRQIVTGTTVAGIAMQLLPEFGVKHMVLVGIDLSDSYRFDGSFNLENSDPKWTAIVDTLNKVIDNRQDCCYYSLGKTRLNIDEE